MKRPTSSSVTDWSKAGSRSAPSSSSPTRLCARKPSPRSRAASSAPRTSSKTSSTRFIANGSPGSAPCRAPPLRQSKPRRLARLPPRSTHRPPPRGRCTRRRWLPQVDPTRWQRDPSAPTRNEPGHEADGVTLNVQASPRSVPSSKAPSTGLCPATSRPRSRATFEGFRKRSGPAAPASANAPHSSASKSSRANAPSPSNSASCSRTASASRPTATSGPTPKCPIAYVPVSRFKIRRASHSPKAETSKACVNNCSARPDTAASGNQLDGVPAWQRATAHYERENLAGWTFGDLPEAIDLAGESGLPPKAFPGLAAESGQIHLRLFPDRAAARASHRTRLHRRPCEHVRKAAIARGYSATWRRWKSLGTDLLPRALAEQLKALLETTHAATSSARRPS